MAVRLIGLLFGGLGELRYQPTEKRIRVTLGGDVIADTQQAMLVWEPKRVVPSYAVPASDIRAQLRPASASLPAPDADLVSMPGGPPVLTPDQSFDLHTCPGEALDVVWADETRTAAGFRPADPDLEGRVILDFPAFGWMEEDDAVLGHPRDPFHRIDIRHSSRHVQVERDGELLADSTRPALLFETGLPVRFYLPPEDVRTDLLLPSPTRTVCAYKGEASYWSTNQDSGSDGGDSHDVAWFYPEPFADAAELTGLIAFFDEHNDVVVDGERRARPSTPWSKPTTHVGRG